MSFMKMSGCMFVAGLFTILAFVVGCGSNNIDMGRVTGRVTLDGQPVPAGVTVTFSPIGLSPSRGITVEGGTYEMLFSFTKKGVMVGNSHVSFEVSNDSKDKNQQKFKIPRKYRDSYGEEITVKSGKQVINFELTSD